MMSKSTYFKELSPKEKKSKLSQFSSKDTVKVWQKGIARREVFNIASFDSSGYQISLYPQTTGLTGKNVLYSFQLNGLTFFGEGLLQGEGTKASMLVCDGNLFKAERRSNFRLLTYPGMNVFVQLHVGVEEAKTSKVIHLRSRTTQTGLFKNFLSLINGGDNSVRDGYIPARVVDTSVSGLAIHVSEHEVKYLEVGKVFQTSYLNFEKDELVIREMKVMYITDALGHDPSTKLFKVGFEFINVKSDFDQQIGGKINELLREQDSEFEEFIK